MTTINRMKANAAKGERQDKAGPDEIERVGAGGEVGEGQSGAKLHKPMGRRDRELGDRERVGAGGPIGDPHYDHR